MSSLKTKIDSDKLSNDKLFNDQNSEISENNTGYLKDENLKETILDFSLSNVIRLRALNIFYEKNGMNETLEFISKLSTMYQFSGSTILKQYLYDICVNTNLNIILKITASKSLCSQNDENDLQGYKAIIIIYPDTIKNDIPIPIRVELLVLLMKCQLYKKETREFFFEIINDQKLECDFRYKTILLLENHVEKEYSYFIKKGFLQFLSNTKNKVSYQILAGQYLLKRCSLTPRQKRITEEKLLCMAQNKDIEYNRRADATDVVLQMGTVQNKKLAKQIIKKLGEEDRTVRTVFDDAQNSHNLEKIDESVEEIVHNLNKFDLLRVNSKYIDFNYVESKIHEFMTSYPEKAKNQVSLSLNRIYMDCATYTKYNCNLKTILLKVYTYIQNNVDNREEMFKRLIEELEHSDGLCSSGYIKNIVNSITGFGEFSFKMTWKEQIIANFSGRLNARARAIQDEEIKGLVLSEMSVKSSDWHNRTNFLAFFRKHMLSIREEMYREFCKHVDDFEFDLYFRDAISKYETG